MNKTALHERHRKLFAKMTDFHGWDMPLYYTSILEEHKAVRQTLGIFDISHMGQVNVEGPDAVSALNQLMVSDISQVGLGRACYTLMLNEAGGIVDDLIVYRIGQERFLIIVNCANRASDMDWLKAHCSSRVNLVDISNGRSILAIQGPLACEVLEGIIHTKIASLGRFDIMNVTSMGSDVYIARTGYTGSDGFELFLPDTKALFVWDAVLSNAKSVGALPVGLGARDTLRLEAGLRLYGTDMDATKTPLEASLGWTVSMGKDAFIGKDALLRQKQQGLSKILVGFELLKGPVPRSGNKLTINGKDVGVVTSGTYSPLLNRPLGMGYVDSAFAKIGTNLTLTVRSLRYSATIVKMPFWTTHGKQTVASGTVISS